MFERYTERSRRVIFFARYEALQYGSQVIAPEHILLGLMREDKNLPARFFPFNHSLTVDVIRRDVEQRIVLRERIPQSSELHLAPLTKRILFYANEESRQLKNRHIGPEHLLLGLVREERSVAAEILFGYGLRLHDVRSEMSKQAAVPGVFNQAPVEEAKPDGLTEYTRDLTRDAADGKLDPLVGREDEIERLIEILCRRCSQPDFVCGRDVRIMTVHVPVLGRRFR